MNMAFRCTLVLLAIGRALSCDTDLDCWLNGDCAAGTCVCDAAWTGDNCNVLSELPSVQLWPPFDIPENLTEFASSWGATIVQDDAGLWHAFFDVVCAQWTWMHVSGAVIVHATSPVVEGPYTYSDVALPQQSMTPHIVRDTDGAWLLLHQRQPGDGVDKLPRCTGDYAAANGPGTCGNATYWEGSSANVARPLYAGAPPAYPNGPPSVARSTSLYGPWVPHDFSIVLPNETILPNPNPSLLPPPTAGGGPYLLAFTQMPANFTTWGTERVAVASAPSCQSGVFTPIVGNGAPGADSPGEDPFMWRSRRGLHIVYHAMDAESNLSFTGVGGYAVSVNGSEWHFSPTPIYTTAVPWAASGGAPLPFHRRERPEFLIDPATGALTHLLTGCELVVDHTGHTSLSVLTPLGPRPAPPQPRRVYSLEVLSKGATPAISLGNPPGAGHSPCNFTYNPAWLAAHPPALNRSMVILRAAGCPPEAGGAIDHLMWTFCGDDGVCDDVLPSSVLPFEVSSDDPRSFYSDADGHWYLYYWHNNTGQRTVNLRRSATPLDPNSWELVVAGLPWHRNGCALPDGPGGRNFVIFGETYGMAYPGQYLPGIGIATTDDWVTYDVLDAQWMEPSGSGPEQEMGIEASTPPLQLSTGDFLHLYAAGTPGWTPLYGPGLCGTYVAGFVILDAADPTRILQRSAVHPLFPSEGYELGTDPRYPVLRNHTLFATSVVPLPGGAVDEFRVWYGAADANVASATIRVSWVWE